MLITILLVAGSLTDMSTKNIQNRLTQFLIIFRKMKKLISSTQANGNQTVPQMLDVRSG